MGKVVADKGIFETWENIWQTSSPFIVGAFGVVGALIGLVTGYDGHGIGAALIFGILGGGIGAVVGALVVAFFYYILPLGLVVGGVIAAIVAVIWFFIAMWNVK